MEWHDDVIGCLKWVVRRVLNTVPMTVLVEALERNISIQLPFRDSICMNKLIIMQLK